MRKRFDPRKFIDREFEQELFEELLRFEDEARILAIQDAGGMGKSSLMEKFQYRCRTIRPRTPVCLLIIDQLYDASPIALVSTAVKQLSSFGMEFTNFIQADSARVSADFMSIRAFIELEGASFQGAYGVEISGVRARFERAEHVTVAAGTPTLTLEQETTAREVCINAFFDDLKAHCAENPVVILIDAYEKAPDRLRDWIAEHFLERWFFDVEARPENLVLVIAGREVPRFDLWWSVEDVDRIVRTVKELGKWRKEHVAECLRVHGYEHYKPEDVDAFYRLIEMGHPPSTIVQLVETTVANQQGGRR